MNFKQLYDMRRTFVNCGHTNREKHFLMKTIEHTLHPVKYKKLPLA